MKLDSKLKIILIILLILLISLISFGGIFVQHTKFVENILPSYKWGMDLTGSRIAELKVSDSKNTVIYDKDGKVVTEEGKDTTKKEEPVNAEELLTAENYKKSKEIMENRLNQMRIVDYTIRFDEKTGHIILELPENTDTDDILQYVAIKGKFLVTDDDKNELLNNSHIEKAQVAYSNTTNGTVVYVTIQFNKEGTQILKDITKTYVRTVNEDGTEQTKNITLSIDDTTLLNTYFEEEISNGIIQLSVGNATTSNSDLNGYVQEASKLAMIINTGSLPLVYTVEDNHYIESNITTNMFYIPMLIGIGALVIALIALIIIYRKNSLLVAISFVGYVAVYLLVLRYANVVLTIEGILGMVIAIIINYIFSIYLLHLLKNNRENLSEEGASDCFKVALLKAIWVLIPVTISSLILCFISWLPIYSFGMTMFWGIILSILYNLIFTKILVVTCANKKKK